MAPAAQYIAGAAAVPPDTDALMRSKHWLPRRFARHAIEAAIEFQRLLSIQPLDGLRDPDGASNAMQSSRYNLGVTLLLTAVRASYHAPVSNFKKAEQDIAGIFALLAAREFKYLLDVQDPSSLFFPGSRRLGITDARQSRSYKAAAELLDLAISNLVQGAAGHRPASSEVPTVRCVVADSTADAPADVLQLAADIKTALVSLGFELLDEQCGGGKDSRPLEFRIGRASQVDQVGKLVESEGNAIHGSASEAVVDQALCHGATNMGEVR